MPLPLPLLVVHLQQDLIDSFELALGLHDLFDLLAGWPRLSEWVAQVGSLWSLPVCAAQEVHSRYDLPEQTSSGCATLVDSKANQPGPPRATAEDRLNFAKCRLAMYSPTEYNHFCPGLIFLKGIGDVVDGVA